MYSCIILKTATAKPTFTANTNTTSSITDNNNNNNNNLGLLHFKYRERTKKHLLTDILTHAGTRTHTHNLSYAINELSHEWSL